MRISLLPATLHQVCQLLSLELRKEGDLRHQLQQRPVLHLHLHRPLVHLPPQQQKQTTRLTAHLGVLYQLELPPILNILPLALNRQILAPRPDHHLSLHYLVKMFVLAPIPPQHLSPLQLPCLQIVCYLTQNNPIPLELRKHLLLTQDLLNRVVVLMGTQVWWFLKVKQKYLEVKLVV